MLKNLPKKIIFSYDLFNTKNELKTQDEIKVTYELSDKCYFKWRQIINSVPKTWKKNTQIKSN